MVKQLVLIAAFSVVGIYYFHHAWTELKEAVSISQHGPDDPKR
jgi:hypothetical protein